MLQIDIQKLLEDHGVAYKTEGKNIVPGEIGLPCPFCGDDPSEHLCINPITGYWFCWRNREHSGQRLHRLLVRLLNCSYTEASRILREGPAVPDGFDKLADQLREGGESRVVPTPEAKPMDWPVGARQIRPGGLCQYYWDYFRHRGFHKDAIIYWLVGVYDLRCCLTGEWNSRILFPIQNQHGEMVGWTGRAVVPASLRYLSCPSGESVKSGLFGLHRLLKGGRRLYIVEGPFDALKLLALLPEEDQAVPLLGTSATGAQVALLLNVGVRFEEVLILLDSAAPFQSMQLREHLAPIEPKIAWLPPEVGDPGDLTPDQLNLIQV